MGGGGLQPKHNKRLLRAHIVERDYNNEDHWSELRNVCVFEAHMDWRHS